MIVQDLSSLEAERGAWSCKMHCIGNFLGGMDRGIGGSLRKGRGGGSCGRGFDFGHPFGGDRTKNVSVIGSEWFIIHFIHGIADDIKASSCFRFLTVWNGNDDKLSGLSRFGSYPSIAGEDKLNFGVDVPCCHTFHLFICTVGGHSYTQDNRDQTSVIVRANIWCRTKGEPAGGAQKRISSGNSLTDCEIKIFLLLIRAVLPSYSETEVSGSAKERGLCGKLNKFVLAYSGGLDTSVVVPWLRENYGCDVVCFTADVGQGLKELEVLEKKAKASGASQLVVKDLKEEFLKKLRDQMAEGPDEGEV
ncbi:unnamed protein product [Prunus armeniaca]|uniref:Arginosuccinate synthase-like N-terminal domain-containing protein n=1 Tax=Prunus armeniaca TaxID=36596 RepID=A0A6J5WG80_PRUAR|nr:unnamed protein product [Prunus armeniaca]